MSENSIRWFWAWLAQITIPKSKKGALSSVGEVWENLILIKAGNAEEAVSKAINLGESLEGDSKGTLLLDGEPAEAIFVGILDMGLVHEELADGCEILFREKRMSLGEVKMKAMDDKELIRILDRELKMGPPAS